MATVMDIVNGAARSDETALIAPFRSLTPAALGNIRRVYDALTPNRDTLGLLFSLDAAQTDPTDQWVAFFVETVVAQLIWDNRPTGTLSENDARWVLARFDEAPTAAVMAVLVRLVEEAHKLPAWLTADIRHRAELFGSAAPRREAAPSQPVPYLRLVA